MKHKFFVFLVILLIIISYLSFTIVLKNQNIDYKSVSGVVKASKLYYAWLGSLFGNFKTMTSYAVKMDWKGNETLS